MKFSVLYLIVILFLGGCSSLESVTSNFLTKMPQSSKESYVVQPGDSIWSIARAVADGRDVRSVVDAIVTANSLSDGNVVAGQKIRVPLA